MSITDEIEAGVRQALPQAQRAVAGEISRLLAAALSHSLPPEEAQARLDRSPALAHALRALDGQTVGSGSAALSISFQGAQTGDVTIGDVAGRDLLKLHIGTINLYYTPPGSALSAQEQRNRRSMLAKVRMIWVDGLLHRSLADELRIDLHLTDRPSALHLPLNAVVQELEQPPAPLRPGVTIPEVFDLMGGELLILGAPGAGKTTLLLELLRDLLQRAEREEAHPIPVVFPLSTWGAERRPLAEWIVEQLNIIYDVPKQLGRAWVSENAILPLLDGLDEVAAEHRAACVDAVNQYRQELGGLAPVAVTSRIGDYESLTARLRLRGAVLIEPLAPQQVAGYLVNAGEPLRAVRELVALDEGVLALLDSPLMLSVVSLAFRDASPETLRAEGSAEEWRQRLWNAYIERMFSRRGKAARYPSEKTRRRLSWVARQLQRHGQTVYALEEMQPTWLLDASRRRYRLSTGVMLGTVYGLAYGLFFAMVSWIAFDRIGALVGGLAGGLFLGVSSGLAFAHSPRGIVLVEGLRWSWANARSSLRSGAVVGLVSGVFNGVMLGLGGAFGYGLVGAVGSGVIVGLISFLGVVVGSGLVAKELSIRVRPNQGIRRSAQSGLIAGLVGAASGGVIGGLFQGVFLELLAGLSFGFVGWAVSGLLLGLFLGLGYGGMAAGQHYILRYFLYREGSLPFRDLVPWLDHCVERLFLHRVGGGYIFIHRMLLEHLAAMPDGDSVAVGNTPT